MQISLKAKCLFCCGMVIFSLGINDRNVIVKKLITDCVDASTSFRKDSFVTQYSIKCLCISESNTTEEIKTPDLPSAAISVDADNAFRLIVVIKNKTSKPFKFQIVSDERQKDPKCKILLDVRYEVLVNKKWTFIKVFRCGGVWALRELITVSSNQELIVSAPLPQGLYNKFKDSNVSIRVRLRCVELNADIISNEITIPAVINKSSSGIAGVKDRSDTLERSNLTTDRKTGADALERSDLSPERKTEGP